MKVLAALTLLLCLDSGYALACYPSRGATEPLEQRVARATLAFVGQVIKINGNSVTFRVDRPISKPGILDTVQAAIRWILGSETNETVTVVQRRNMCVSSFGEGEWWLVAGDDDDDYQHSFAFGREMSSDCRLDDETFDCKRARIGGLSFDEWQLLEKVIARTPLQQSR